MSSNGEKRMMKRSDFAQKLLDDLRVRKEQLSGSQNSLQKGMNELALIHETREHVAKLDS